MSANVSASQDKAVLSTELLEIENANHTSSHGNLSSSKNGRQSPNIGPGERHNKASPEQDFAPDDSENPRNWSPMKKVLVITGPLLAAFMPVFGTAIYVASIPGIESQFNVSITLAISPISIYGLGQIIGPMLSSTASELFGRQILYRVCLPLAIIFTACAGSASTFPTMVVLRFLGSVAISPCSAVGLGVVNDLWDTSTSKLGTLFAVIYATMILIPTFIAPMVSPAIVEARGWRWTFWLNAILIGVALVATFPGPETFKPEILRRRAKKKGATVTAPRSAKELCSIALMRPILMAIMEPIIIPTALVSAVGQAVIFCFYVAYPLAFQEFYGFTTKQIGLAFAPLLVGNFIAIPIIGIFDKRKYQSARLEAIRTGIPVSPELRLYPVMVGSICMPISLFWLAWTANPIIHWSCPVMSGLLYGIGYTLTMLGYPIYKNDIYGAAYGASAFTVEVVLRYALSAATPLFTIRVVDRIGFHWFITILACVELLLLPIPWVLFRYGYKLRARSHYVAQQEADALTR